MKTAGTQNRQRFLMMLTGAFAIFFTGFPHVWSVYQPYITEGTGWTQSQGTMCFYLALSAFVFGNILGGRMQNRFGQRKILFLGGGLLSAGVLMSAFSLVSSPLPMYLTYGVMQGLGQGMMYTVILASAQQWFPDRTGFASGIVITANGLCGLFMAPLSRQLLEKEGPKATLLTVGVLMAAAWLLSSLFFAFPEEKKENTETGVTDENNRCRQYTSREMLHTKQFYFLLATMLFGLILYFMISPISQNYQLELGIPAAAAVSSVMIGSVVNALTRLVLPSLADKVGRIVCVKGVLVIAAAAMILLCFSNSYGATIAVILIYGCYGGIMGSFPSLTSSVFGIRHAGENYGFVMLGIVIATFGTPVLTRMINIGENGMRYVFAAGAVFAAAAFVFIEMLRKTLNKSDRSDDYGIGNNEKTASAGKK